MEPVTPIQSIVALALVSYIMMAGIMIIISPKNGLRRTNRLFRRALALPIKWLGEILLALAKAVRGGK